MSHHPDMNHDEGYYEKEEEDYTQGRSGWRIVSWIIVVLTIVLNLVIVGTLLVKQNAYAVINKAILLMGIVDLLYGIFVSPFFVENYIDLNWTQSYSYCKFYEYYFTFHDIFVPTALTLLSAHVALKFSGASAAIPHRKKVGYVLTFVTFIGPILLAIPTAYMSSIFEEDPKIGASQYKRECLSHNLYSMILSFCSGSSILFCFTMSFLHSLCIVGSPFLKDVHDKHEYSQRWRLMLCLSLVNICYIITGFLHNFKEISRYFMMCCKIIEPFRSINTMTYDIWSFVLLISEPFLRPLVYLAFYFKYLLDDPMAYY